MKRTYYQSKNKMPQKYKINRKKRKTRIETGVML